MKLSKLYGILDTLYPSELSCDWDNDGIMTMCSDREVKRILICLDCTDAAIEKAVSGGFDAIITHHPFVFHKLSGIVGERYGKLIKNDIAVFSFHTRFDSAHGGVNDCLAKLLGINSPEAFAVMGRYGMLSEKMKTADFVRFAKEKLSSPSVEYSPVNEYAEKVAVLGGGGGDFAKDAAALGCDTLVTGEADYDVMIDAEKLGITVIAAGHFETENPAMSYIENVISEACLSVYTERFDSNTIKYV